MLTVYRLVTPLGTTDEIIEHRCSEDIIEDWREKGFNVEIVREDKDDE